MRCPYCNAEISDDSLFCGSCGKKLPQQKECVKCGKPIDSNSDFCPYCGAKQDSSVSAPIESEKLSIPPSKLKRGILSSKTVSVIVGCILVLAVIGGVAYYWFEIREDYSLEKLAKITTGEYELYDFHDGYAAIKKNDMLGVINKKGEIIVHPIYHPGMNTDSDGNTCYAFMSEDRMLLSKKIDGKLKYGFIDKDGKEIIPFIYEEARNFTNGLSQVRKDGKRGYIDKEGKEVIPLIYRCATTFYSDLALVSKNARKCEYIDKSGKVKASFDFTWDEIEEITKGGIIVRKEDKYGFVNNQGKLVVPCTYDRINSGFCDDLLCVLKDNNFGYFNISGKEIVPCKYGMGLSSQNGIAKVFDEWGGHNGTYIDSAGKVLFSFVEADRLDSYGDFYEDYAVVSHQGLSGYIDKTGKEVISLLYESAQRFSEGLAGVKRDGLWGFIDKKGNEVIPFIYEDAKYFSDGLALVKKDGMWGYIDKNGKSTFDYQ